MKNEDSATEKDLRNFLLFCVNLSFLLDCCPDEAETIQNVIEGKIPLSSLLRDLESKAGYQVDLNAHTGFATAYLTVPKGMIFGKHEKKGFHDIKKIVKNRRSGFRR